MRWRGPTRFSSTVSKIFGVAALFLIAALTMVGLRVRSVPAARPAARPSARPSVASPAIPRQAAVRAGAGLEEFQGFEGADGDERSASTRCRRPDEAG